MIKAQKKIMLADMANRPQPLTSWSYQNIIASHFPGIEGCGRGARRPAGVLCHNYSRPRRVSLPRAARPQVPGRSGPTSQLLRVGVVANDAEGATVQQGRSAMGVAGVVVVISAVVLIAGLGCSSSGHAPTSSRSADRPYDGSPALT